MSMEKEIIEGNKLIAEFMGLRIDRFPDGHDTWIVDVNNIQSIYHNASIENWAFNTSWDWLMPVVEKIDDNKFVDKADGGVSICGADGTTIYLVNTKLPFIHRVGADRINGCWLAVIEFIKWYNQQHS